ncbi:hypothetical protein LDENG_00092480 [Lucifuga dentata]|nr:hypothetical protein LDENG_00092480 [Lucifuga dentata]
MSNFEHLRALVNQRLSLAAEDIFRLFARTIAEYEEENARQRRLLRPEINNTVLQQDAQKCNMSEEEQQEWIHHVDQDGLQPPRIKQEQEEVGDSQVGETIGRWREADVSRIPLTGIPVKSKNDEGKALSSQPQQRQTEPLASSSTQQIKSEANAEDCGGPEPGRNADLTYSHAATDCRRPKTENCNDDWKESLSCFRAEAEDSDGEKETKELQSALKPLSDAGCVAGKNLFSCSQCGKTFGSSQYLHRHMQCHTEAKILLCPFCGKRFTKNSNLTTHLRVHTGEKPFTCSVCNTSFSLRCTLVAHMRVHTGEKPFSCFFCSKRFAKKANLKVHMAVHTEEKAYSCSVCNKRFAWHSQIKSHKCVAASSSSQ